MHYCRPFWIGHFEVCYERDENMENRHLTFYPLPVRGGEETRHPSVFAKLPPSSDYGEISRRDEKENCQSFWRIDKTHARKHCSVMKRTLCFVSLAALLTGGCAWYKIQPISADSLNGWGKTNCLSEGYIFYQPELYFSATIVTESTGSTSKQNVTVTPIWLPNYQKPYRVTTHNILAKADFTFSFENGWKLTSIADKGDSSTVANTLAGQLTTVLKAAEGLRVPNPLASAKTRVILYRPVYNPTNGYISKFEPVEVPIGD